jgi:ribosomal protein S25
MTVSEEKYVSRKELAERLSLNVQSIIKLEKRGVIVPLIVNSKPRYKLSECLENIVTDTVNQMIQNKK